MLHDMGPEARASAAQAAADMNRANSGLESMQSIDDALGNVEQDIMDKVANDWVQTHPQAPRPSTDSLCTKLQGRACCLKIPPRHSIAELFAQ